MLVLGALPILGVLMNGEIQSQRADVHIRLSNSPRATLRNPKKCPLLPISVCTLALTSIDST